MKMGRSFLLKLTTAILVCGLLGTLGFSAVRNNEGYCSASGMRTTDAQKVDAAIAYLLKTYPSAAALDQALLRSAASEKDRPPTGNRPIPYQSVDHFKRMNPECCRVLAQPSDPEFPPSDLLDRIVGAKESFVVIRYRLLYLTPSGEQRARSAALTVAVTNCGEIWSGI